MDHNDCHSRWRVNNGTYKPKNKEVPPDDDETQHFRRMSVFLTKSVPVQPPHITMPFGQPNGRPSGEPQTDFTDHLQEVRDVIS